MVVRRSVILKPARGYVDGKYIGEERESISGVDDTKRHGNKNGNTTKRSGKRSPGALGGRRTGAGGNANAGNRADNFGNTIAPPRNKRSGGRTGAGGGGSRREPNGRQTDGNVLPQTLDPRADHNNNRRSRNGKPQGRRPDTRGDNRGNNRGPRPDRSVGNNTHLENGGSAETNSNAIDGNSSVVQATDGQDRQRNNRGRNNNPRRGPRQDRGPRPAREANGNSGEGISPTSNMGDAAAAPTIDPATGEARPAREAREPRGLRRGRTRTQSTRGGPRPPRENGELGAVDGNADNTGQSSDRPPRLNSDGTPRLDRPGGGNRNGNNRRGRNARHGRNDRSGQNRTQAPRDAQDVQIEERFFAPQIKLAVGVDGEAIINSDGNHVRAKNRQPPTNTNARKNRGGKKTPFRQALPRGPVGPIDEDNIGNMIGGPANRGNRFATPSEIADQRRQTEEAKSGQFAEALATKQVIKRERLHKIMAQSGLGSRRDMELMITAGRIMVNGIVAGAGTQVSEGDVVMVDQRPIRLRFTAEIPRVMLYHKPDGEIVTTNDPGNRITVFDNLPRVESGKWIAIGRLDISTSGLLIFTTNGELANRMMHPRFEVEREYAVRILGELTQEQTQTLLDGVRIDDAAIAAARARAGLPAYDAEDADDLDENSEHEKDSLSAADRPARFDSIEARGGDGANHWYQVVIKEGRNREVRKMFESQGLIVSRLLRTRFGKIELPPRLGRGKMVELEAGQVKALLNWAGVKIEGVTDGASSGKNRDRNQREGAQPRQVREPQTAKPQRDEAQTNQSADAKPAKTPKAPRPPRQTNIKRMQPSADNGDGIMQLDDALPVLSSIDADFSNDFEVPTSMPTALQMQPAAKKPRSPRTKSVPILPTLDALPNSDGGNRESPPTDTIDKVAKTSETSETNATSTKPKATKRALRATAKSDIASIAPATPAAAALSGDTAEVETPVKPATKRARAPVKAKTVATAPRTKKVAVPEITTVEANGNVIPASVKVPAEIDLLDDDIGNR
jgi:23S rRNA pseudouridine2605 synthase